MRKKPTRLLAGSVQRAREALQAKAEEYVELHAIAARNAAKRGNSQPSQWALEHITALDESGKEIRPVGSGIDRQQIDAGKSGITVNVGWIAAPGALQSGSSPDIIDVSPIEPKQLAPSDDDPS